MLIAAAGRLVKTPLYIAAKPSAAIAEGLKLPEVAKVYRGPTAEQVQARPTKWRTP